jgi:hypothetical protein
VVREPDQVVVQASANAGALLGLDGVIGRRLRDLGGDLAAAILPRTLEALERVPAASGCAPARKAPSSMR